MAFDNTPENMAAIEAAMSTERLKSYLDHCHQVKADAIKLYARNTALSEALYGPLQAVEVVVRNALHGQLAAHFGAPWFDILEQSGTFHFDQVERLKDARDRLAKQNKPLTSGRLVAELSFGFWSSLCASRYTDMWIHQLRHGFAKGLSRKVVFERLDSIRVLRNRVAHHEPIWNRNLADDHEKIIEAVAWVCPISAKWVRSTSSLVERLAAV